MRQVLQNLRTGATEVAEIPCPAVHAGQILIRTSRTLVSTGTERMLVEFGRAGWIDKARQQPDRAKVVLDKVRTDGLVPTVEAVLNKLDQPIALGYCNVGFAMELGAGVTGVAVGDRLVSNGQHAEVVTVANNLCVKVPENVSSDEAAFTIIGAIALQGIRLVQPTLGEAVVVTGLGLIGLVTVQLLMAHGCRVLGMDFDSTRVALAKQLGADVVHLGAGDDPLAAARAFSRGRGVDAVIITAATSSNEPVHQAAAMSRKRGRIVLVGTAGLELSRADFYEKELSFQVSCSYGPGRYDASYEEKGADYPIGFVRWTAQRNFEAVLDMIADGRLDVKPLISHRFPIGEADRAYALVGGSEASLGILLEYPSATAKPDAELRQATVNLRAASAAAEPETRQGPKPAVAFVGSGNYATAVLIPAFKEAGVRLKTVASSRGITGVHAGRKYGFEKTTTDTDTVFADPAINTIVVATRHDTHAPLAIRGLRAGKHVFVEKPLALSMDEVEGVEQAYSVASQSDRRPLLMVGFNRRFAPHVRKMKELLAVTHEPKLFLMTVNAGAIPKQHWTQDPAIGGGRIIGEGCHFIDLLRFLAAAPITGSDALPVGHGAGLSAPQDQASIALRFADGSVGSILYLTNGHKSFPKERLEVFVGGRILQLDNFRKLTGYGWPGFSAMKLWRQDKGQTACAAAFARAIEQGGASPIPFAELMEVSRVTIAVGEMVRLASD